MNESHLSGSWRTDGMYHMQYTEDGRTYTVSASSPSEAREKLRAELAYGPSPPLADAPAPGRKDDRGKLRWSLVPWAAMREVARVLTSGAKKYGDHNWKEVQPTDRYFDALMRHLTDRYVNGEERDRDNPSQYNMACVVCCALFLLWHDVTNSVTDIRDE